MATPMRTPGPIPAWNIASVDVWLKNAQTTKLMDGGMIGPMPADAAVTATEKSGSYPAFVIALTSMVPSPPASASAEPDIPANTMEDKTFACARPPGRWPIHFSNIPNSRSVNPTSFIKHPTNKNAGNASILKSAREFAVSSVRT